MAEERMEEDGYEVNMNGVDRFEVRVRALVTERGGSRSKAAEQRNRTEAVPSRTRRFVGRKCRKDSTNKSEKRAWRQCGIDRAVVGERERERWGVRAVFPLHRLGARGGRKKTREQGTRRLSLSPSLLLSRCTGEKESLKGRNGAGELLRQSFLSAWRSRAERASLDRPMLA